VVNARFPAPVVSGNTETSLRIIDTVSAALARVIPQRVIASDSGTATAHIAGASTPATVSTMPGTWAPTHGLGGPGDQGRLRVGRGPRIGGSVCQVSMEVFETRYPFLVEEYAFYPRLRRPGRFRGGMSGVTVMRPVGHECEVGGANDRCVIPPYGIFGGMPGLHGENKIIHADGSETPIDRAGGEIAREGDVLYFRAPGGAATVILSTAISTTCNTTLTSVWCPGRAPARTTAAVVDEATGAIDRQATEANRAGLKGEWRRDRSSSTS